MVLASFIDAPSTIRVLVADSRRFFAAGLTRLLSEQSSIDIVAEASDAPSVLRAVRDEAPPVALISHGLIEETAGLLDEIRAVAPGTAAIVYGMPPAPEILIESLRAGAKGLVDQEAGLGDVIAAVEGVAAGRIVISPHLAAQMGARQGDAWRGRAAAAEGHPLSPREVDVLRLVADGASNRAAAVALGLSEHTVRAHLRAILRKLVVQGRVQAVARGIELGLVPPTRAAVRHR
jgi:DNA-binding NarL/FixJ family response regulator